MGGIESKFQLTLARLAEALIATGAKYGGISPRPTRGTEAPHFIEDGVGFYVELNHDPEATAEDRTKLIDVWLAFDFTQQRQVKPRAALRQAVQGLTAAQRNTILVELIVDLLGENPRYAKRLQDVGEEVPAIQNDHVTVLDSGMLLAQGNPTEVLARKDVVEAYLGE